MQWHQLDDMQVRTLLQTDNNTSTMHHATQYFTGQMPFLAPSQQHKSTKAWRTANKSNIISFRCKQSAPRSRHITAPTPHHVSEMVRFCIQWPSVFHTVCSRLCTAFPAQHLRPSGVLSCWCDGLELTPGFYPGFNEQHRLFYVST